MTTRLYDRATGGTVVADNDDAEWDNLITTYDAHVSALNPHTNSLNKTGDTMTGTLLIDQNSDAISLNIDSEATTADVVNLSGAVLTTGIGIDLADLNALTTGSALNLVSNSADVSVRTLMQLTNDNAAAVGTTCFQIKNDSTNFALDIQQTGVLAASDYALNVYSNAVQTTSPLVFIKQDNAGSTATVACLEIQNDAATSAALTIAATNRIYLDGGSNTFIEETSADVVSFYVGAVRSFWLTYAAPNVYANFQHDVYLQPTKKLYFDGGGDTYIFEQGANNIQIVCGTTVAIDANLGVVTLPNVDTADTANCQISAGGIITHPTPSSIRYKKNVVPFDYDSSKLYNLNVVSFDYKNDNSRGHGFIAENVHECFPFAVYSGKEHEIEGVNLDKLVIPLVAEIKKLKARIEVLEAK